MTKVKVFVFGRRRRQQRRRRRRRRRRRGNDNSSPEFRHGEIKISGVSKMGDNEQYSIISPIANEYKHFLALFVGVLYGRI